MRDSANAQGERVAADVRRLGPADLALMHGLLEMFGRAFDDMDTYTGARPSAAYLRERLADDTFIALAAVRDGQVVGGLVAFVLRKFERERSEIYIYDLAVAEAHRRQGIASTLIAALEPIAERCGAHAVFVQADTGVEDRPAIALYSKLGRPERVLHFDIAFAPERGADRTGQRDDGANGGDA